MPRPVILTAGRAVRAGSYAPNGCKSLVPLDGRPIIEWQMACFDSEPLIVARSEHAHDLAAYGDVVTNDSCLGPGDALRSALRVLDDEPITVVYADSFFTDVPDGSDWVGTGIGWGGRPWDVIMPNGVVSYCDPQREALVCVGLYSFSNLARLREEVHYWSGYHAKPSPHEWGLSWVLGRYPTKRWEPVPSWVDIGDVAGIEGWSNRAA